MPLPLELLPYFVAVAEELHFGAAAARLCMTQPPLSQRIKQLEESLQVCLFVRTTRHVQLTPAGEVLLKRAKALLAAAEEAREAAERADRGQVGTLRLGFTSSSAYKILPLVLSRFTRAYPDVALDLRERVSLTLMDDLLSRRIDVALLRPTAAVHAQLESTIADEERMVLAMHKDHPLARLRSVQTRRLDGVPIIGFSAADSPYFRNVLADLFAAAAVRASIVRESVLPTILALVEAQLGVGIVPASAATLRTGHVLYRPLIGAGSRVTAVLHCVRHTSTDDPITRNFLECLRLAATDLSRCRHP
jgi:DNA-binding transcriptional LysR family regulator